MGCARPARNESRHARTLTRWPRRRDVREVRVAVVRAVPVVPRGERAARPSPELRMRGADAGVDDVCVHAGAVDVEGVVPVEGQVALVDAIEPPRGAGLRDVEVDLGILLYPGDPR